ncbi:GNAT family N-acetyltransferase [Sphingobacterium mizutaii]|uniref:GNAT family N-acetyltransferase n=1 Tax=Sphingobacterium mizutaii TaxID=1010 RepID=UPI001F2C1785|nr:GNAT family N-acetyltransferase [Sphingobacterium mizutaii]
MMSPISETKRLILRQISLTDRIDMFEMDSDPLVHRYIFNQPIESIQEIDEAIQFIQKQYQENGIGRWAIVKKDNMEMIGWCGLKYIDYPLNGRSNFYDLGYRLKRKHWGNGYASEACIATVIYAKEVMNLKNLYATVHPENIGSLNVLKKMGFEIGEIFDYEGSPSFFCELDLDKFIF